MSNLHIMEAVNLFCGADSPNESKHLTLQELKLPALTESYQEHMAGGAMVGIEIPVGIQKMEATFKLVGWDPHLMTRFGLGARQTHTYTAYGAIVDQRTGRRIEAKAVMEGRLGKIEGDAFTRGDLQTHDYMISAITHYELYYDSVEKVFFDFWTSAWRIDGQSENAATNVILGIG